MMPLLTTKGLSRNFGGLRAVDGVDFALMPGEIRAVIGPNGAGKTTFVSLVSGRIQPSSGMIVFDGADITNLPAYARVRLGIAYTFQITSVFANLTAYDNVALPVQRTLTDGRSKGAVRMPASWRRSSAPALPTAPTCRPGNCPMAISACSKWRWGWR